MLGNLHSLLCNWQLVNEFSWKESNYQISTCNGDRQYEHRSHLSPLELIIFNSTQKLSFLGNVLLTSVEAVLKAIKTVMANDMQNLLPWLILAYKLSTFSLNPCLIIPSL